MRKHTRVMLAALLVVVGVLVFLPSSYVSAGGSVVNSGFEHGEEQEPEGWVLIGNAMRIDTEHIYAGNWSAGNWSAGNWSDQETGYIYAGNWSAQVTGHGDTLIQWIANITATRAYEAWGWIYVSGNVTGVIAIDFWKVTEDGASQLSSTTILSTTDTNGIYVQKAGIMQSPSSTTHVRIQLYGTGWSDGAVVRFDDIGFWWPATGTYCFIATAAYGTPMAEEIGILRQFRDEYLLTNPMGNALVDLYYRVSPPMADFITAHPSLKPIVRTGLVPAVAMSTVVVNTTPVEKAAIAGLLVLISVIVVVWATRRRGRGPEYI
jgi:hypothetical protein